MKFTATMDELKAEKWRFRVARKCKLCDADLEFWETPNKTLMPLELDIVDNRFVFLSH